MDYREGGLEEEEDEEVGMTKENARLINVSGQTGGGRPPPTAPRFVRLWPFTSEVVCSILATNFTHEESPSKFYQKLWAFSGSSNFFPQGT